MSEPIRVSTSLLEDVPPLIDVVVSRLLADRQAELRHRRLWGLPVIEDPAVPAGLGPFVVKAPVEPLAAELNATPAFLEQMARVVRAASRPRFRPNPYVPDDVVVQIAGDRRLFYNPRDRHGYPSRIERALHPTPGYTRHMLGAREAARDWRLHR